jgi:DNA-binding LytR/AlgR family response regulator
MLNCLIIDDEPLALNILESYISNVPELHLVARCNSAVEAMEMMHNYSIHVMFLDINMPMIDGLSFLRSLKNSPHVILTTAYSHHAIESYELDVVDYLLKPIPFERFLKAVNKLFNLQKNSLSSINTHAPVGYIFIKVDGRMVKLNYEEIVYIEGLKDYLKVHTCERHYVTHMTMKKMEETLPSNSFIRIHKSFILSLNAVKSISGNTVETIKDALPIGAMYKEKLVKNIFKIQL